jgi:hypothetical protein
MQFGIATILALTLSTTSAFAAGCTAPQSRQFDFWVGKWKVYPNTANAKQVANSVIENLYAGCAIRENWMPLHGPAGGSLSTYNGARWEQFWVDATGSVAHFTGGWNGKSMVIQGVWPQPGHANQITRMTYTPRKNGAVEQAGQISNDGGKTWLPGFDFLYKPATSSP